MSSVFQTNALKTNPSFDILIVGLLSDIVSSAYTSITGQEINFELGEKIMNGA
jgi:hypothetical protein